MEFDNIVRARLQKNEAERLQRESDRFCDEARKEIVGDKWLWTSPMVTPIEREYWPLIGLGRVGSLAQIVATSPVSTKTGLVNVELRLVYPDSVRVPGVDVPIDRLLISFPGHSNTLYSLSEGGNRRYPTKSNSVDKAIAETSGGISYLLKRIDESGSAIGLSDAQRLMPNIVGPMIYRIAALFGSRNGARRGALRPQDV